MNTSSPLTFFLYVLIAYLASVWAAGRHIRTGKLIFLILALTPLVPTYWIHPTSLSVTLALVVAAVVVGCGAVIGVRTVKQRRLQKV